jgi:uncharacterized protein (TIGR02145 family)
MKKLYTFLATTLVVATLWAQTPSKMTYQAVIRNADSQLVTNTQVGMRISILQGTADGSAVYTETLTPTTNANGLVSVVIGGAAGFDAIDWANGPYFIKTETDPSGGTSYTITGVSQLLTVPYALHAKTVESIEETQSLADVAAIDNSVNTQIKNLTDPSDAQDAATKAYVDLLEGRITALENKMALMEGLKDIDGNEYEIVIIGNQIWMAENLRTTKYNDGTPIPTGHSNAQWEALTTGAYSVYPHSSISGLNSDAEVLEAYGALYNWYAVETGNLCPTGWRVPTDAEWTTLTDYVGEASVAGGKLKSTRTAPDAHPRWGSPNTSATDEYGFSALPGGDRSGDGAFYDVGDDGLWWSSTENNTYNAWFRFVDYFYSDVFRGSYNKELGFSVRCLRDL